MKIIHAVSSIDAEASGPSYSVPRICSSLAALGCRPDIISLGIAEENANKGMQVIKCKPDWPFMPVIKRLGRSRSMQRFLMGSDADIFHTHGLWMMPNVYPAEAALHLGKPCFLSPRGMLGRDALRFSRTAKRLFWALWQKGAVDNVTCFHATAESEYEDIRALGLNAPVAVIPNGIDLPDLSKISSTKRSGGQPSEEHPFILSLGRIHPKKGLDRLIAAFALIADDNPEWRLRIVGPSERGHAAELSRQVSSLRLDYRISVEPPVFGDDKLRLMSQAEVFALPTLHENFGMTVAESLAVATPVVSSKGAPWAGLDEHRCGWWVDHGPEAMAAALRKAIEISPNERRAMGVRGRNWMQRDFAWDGIGAKMIDAYRWSLGEIDRPDWVWK